MTSSESLLIKEEKQEDLLLQENEYLRSVRNGNLYWAAFAALLASLSCGFAMGYSSPAIADLKVVMFRRLKMKQLDAAWFGSILAIGAIIGVLLCMWLINLIGRKLTLVLSSLPLIFGNTVIIASPSVWVLCFGRLLTGVATGLASLVVPIYLTEISHRRKKRILISCIPMMVMMGVFGVYSAGMVFAWRWLALCCCASSFMMLLAMVVMPETPRFLLQQKRRSDALAALTFLRGPDADHEWELKQIEDSIRIRGDKFHMKDLMDPTIYKPLYICSLLMLFQQLTGMYAIIFYAEIMIEEANFQDSGLAAVVVGAILFVFTVVFISIVDKTGRKVLLIVSGAIMAASAVCLSVYFHLNHSSKKNEDKEEKSFSTKTRGIDWLEICSLGTFVAGFAIGWGHVPGLMMSEVFPWRVRALGTGFCLLIHWIIAFLVTMVYFDLIDGLTPFGAFLFFLGFCVIGIIFIICSVPETRGKTLSEISDFFQKRPSKK